VDNDMKRKLSWDILGVKYASLVIIKKVSVL